MLCSPLRAKRRVPPRGQWSGCHSEAAPKNLSPGLRRCLLWQAAPCTLREILRCAQNDRSFLLRKIFSKFIVEGRHCFARRSAAKRRVPPWGQRSGCHSEATPKNLSPGLRRRLLWQAAPCAAREILRCVQNDRSFLLRKALLHDVVQQYPIDVV